MYRPTRDQARNIFFDCWSKYRAGEPVQGIETLALEVVLQHPEYHRVLDDPDRYRDRDWQPEGGTTNPFLHLSLHLALQEQLSIDQPPGIRERYQRLLDMAGEPHQAQHAALECLAETIWRAQRDGQAPDAVLYLRCLDGEP